MARPRKDEMVWEPKPKKCKRCRIKMNFTFDFCKENLEWQRINAKELYDHWQHCEMCIEAIRAELAGDKTLHRQFEVFSKLDATEQRRRARLGLFEDLPDELI